MNVDEQLQRLANDVRDIKLAVIGDEDLGVTGLVHRVHRIERWKDRIDLRTAAIGGGVVVVGAALKWIFHI